MPTSRCSHSFFCGVALTLLAACSDDAATSTSTDGDTTSADGTTTSSSPNAGGNGTGGDAAGGSASGGSASGGSASGGNGGGGSPPLTCPVCVETDPIGPLKTTSLTEASGIVSATSSGIDWYTHNDSGDSPRFFAVQGTSATPIPVMGATATDWEDIARGKCADGTSSCLFFADIGNNAAYDANPPARKYKFFRAAEPKTPLPANVTADAIEYTYPTDDGFPKGHQNAEAAAFDPATGKLVVLTKHPDDPRIYTLSPPFSTAMPVQATLEGKPTIPSGDAKIITGMDIRQSDGAVLVRTYGQVYFYLRANGQPIADALSTEPCAVPHPSEPQGEAISFTKDGKGFVTISELGGGQTMPTIHTFSCNGM